MHMGIAIMVLLQAVRAGGAPRCTQPPGPGHCLKCVAMHSCAPATGLPLLPVVCLLVTMGMDMNEWLIAWIVLL